MGNQVLKVNKKKSEVYHKGERQLINSIDIRADRIIDDALFILETKQRIEKESKENTPDKELIKRCVDLVSNLKHTIETDLKSLYPNSKSVDEQRVKDVVSDIENGNIAPVKMLLADLLAQRNPGMYGRGSR